jgi:kynurenine formamidase
MPQRVFDLSQPYFPGMPHFPTHPPFLFGLTKLHGEVVGPNGMSSAADSIAFSGHCGTHIDALGHFSCAGFVYGEAAVKQSYTGGLESHDAASIEPIVRRGVLLDVARTRGVRALEVQDEVTAADLDRACSAHRITIEPGDVVMMRLGWGHFFDDAKRYVNGGTMPGVNLEAAKWLSEHRVFAAGSDTLAFEKLPNPAMSVHVHLLVEQGIHLIENLQLEELSTAQAYEFQIVAAPLKIRGGTGAPVRPLALVEKQQE